jgi:MFS family permease
VDSSLTAAFLRWALIRAALARGWWLATAVYLVVVAELSPAQLVLVGVFQGVTVVIAEVPAGVLADTISRRLTLVVAHVVMGAGMTLTGLVTGYPLVVLGQCLWGLGWAISSGADVAWITDELDRSDVIDRVLTAQGRYDLLGTPVGIVGFGALAWATTLSTAIVVAGLGMVGLGLLVVARWPESRHLRTSAGRRWAATISIFRWGLATARRDRAIALVLAATLLVNGGAEGFGRLFERRLINLGIPASPAPIVWFAAIGLVAAALGAAILYWIEARIHGEGVAKAAYVAASGIAATGLVMFAHAPNIESAVAAALLVKAVGFPTVRVAATILVNRRTTSEARATVHSVLSQAENMGEILCGLLLAAVAATWSPMITLIGSALLVAAAGVTVSRAPTGTRERPDGATRSDGAGPMDRGTCIRVARPRHEALLKG